MGWTFEFDRAKSETNRVKHGIDFAEEALYESSGS